MKFQDAFREIERRFWAAKGERDAYIKQKEEFLTELAVVKEERQEWVLCDSIFKEAALITQKQFATQIESIAQIVLDAVLGTDVYKLIVELEFKYSKNHAKIWLKKGENKISPLQTSGGVAELAAFSVILALFRIASRERANILFLDEPFKSLKGQEYPLKAANILFSLAHKLGIQVVIISHSHVQIHFADTVYKIEQNNGQSTAILLEKGKDDVAENENPLTD